MARQNASTRGRSARRERRKRSDAPSLAAGLPARLQFAWVGVFVLAAIFFAQSFSASLQKSATFDEPAHIGAGLSYLGTRRIVVGPEHPPLLKELSALALNAAAVDSH